MIYIYTFGIMDYDYVWIMNHFLSGMHIQKGKLEGNQGK